MSQNRNGDNQVVIYNCIWACCSAYCTVSLTNWASNNYYFWWSLRGCISNRLMLCKSFSLSFFLVRSHLILTLVSLITAMYTFDKLFILLIVQKPLSVGWTYILMWTDWEVTQPTDVTHVSLIVYQTLRYSCSWNGIEIWDDDRYMHLLFVMAVVNSLNNLLETQLLNSNGPECFEMYMQTLYHIYHFWLS